MFELDAAIVPGCSAAGIRIGQELDPLLRFLRPFETMQLHGCQRLRFPMVDLWVSDRKVEQIGVSRGYRGRVRDKIGIGATIAEIEAAFGSVTEDEEDNLIVAGEQGWCFEVEGYAPGRQPSECPQARISEIYVFGVERGR
jgi:hypothetical protein